MKRWYKVALGLCLAFLSAGPAWGEGKLTLVASPEQVADMGALLEELKAEQVEVTTVDPADIASALGDDRLMIVTTADDAAAPVVAEKLSAPDRERVARPGGMKYVLLRDPWKAGQEVVVLAAHSGADAAALRKKAWANWWETVAGWYEINTMIVPNY